MDALTEHHLHSEPKEAPFLLVALDGNGDIITIHIIGDGKDVFGQTENVLDAIVLLIAVYYVFDLSYPRAYDQFLGFIQHWVIGDPFGEAKVSGWVKMSDLLSRNQSVTESPKC